MSIKKLTDTQRVVLSHAAMQLGGALLPMPKSIRLNAGAISIVLKSLVSQGLALERAVTRDESVWRQEENGDRFGLYISDEGCGAIGVDPVASAGGDEEALRSPTRTISASTATARPSSPKRLVQTDELRTGTKLAILITALRKQNGATISDLMTATGWQAHSVRGAISGALKKKLGLGVYSETDSKRGRVYHLASAAPSDGTPAAAKPKSPTARSRKSGGVGAGA